ncbi:hypothetical protein BGW41_002543 [Actinomortierella wolfii]|nr:hypothetical protein BGW41_002543 [Actinomortierella wolfii]
MQEILATLLRYAPVTIRLLSGMMGINDPDTLSTGHGGCASLVTTACILAYNAKSGHRANYLQMMMAIYLRSLCCPKSAYPVFNRADLSTSYDVLERSLASVNASAVDLVKRLAQTAPFFVSFDNIDIFLRSYHQRINNRDELTRGTAATLVCHVVPPPGTRIFNGQRPVKPEPYHILPSIPDTSLSADFIDILQHHFLNNLRQSNQETGFWTTTLGDRSKCLKGKTKAHPLPVFQHRQSTTDGVISTLKELLVALGISPGDVEENNTIIVDDLFTMDKIDHVKRLLSRDDPHFERMEWAVPMTRLFHLQTALMHTIIQTHWGDISTPGSLHFLVARLKRKQVNNKSKSNFDAGNAFLRMTCIAMCRHLWDIEGKTFRRRFKINEDGENWSNEAKTAFHQWINDLFFGPSDDEDVEQELELQLEHEEGAAAQEQKHEERQQEQQEELVDEWEPEREQDQGEDYEQEQEWEYKGELPAVSRNARLFVRDFIIFQELEASIRAGDLDRIQRVLHIITIMLQDARTPRYAAELLRLTFLMRAGWTSEWKRTALSCMIINPSGRDNGFIPTDQYQEQSIRMIKDMNMPSTTGMSWQYLIASITPIIRLLTNMKVKIEKEFKISFNSNRPLPIAIDHDVRRALNIFRKHNVLASRDTQYKYSKDLLDAGLRKLLRHNGLDKLQSAYTSDYTADYESGEDDDDEIEMESREDEKAMDMLDDDFSHELFSYLSED